MGTQDYKWLVLVYYLPPEAGSARVRVWRKMKKLGMVSFRNSVYFLPFSEENHEITQWLCQEIQKAGGEATLLKTESVENLTDEEVAGFFRKARGEDYDQLARDAGELFKRLDSLSRARESTGSDVGAAGMTTLADDLKALEKRLAETREIDFFQAPGGGKAEEIVSSCRMVMRKLHKQEEPPARVDRPRLDTADFQGKTWVTRPRPYIDRIATAWAIRRLIDPEARFVFAEDPASAEGAIPFDYIETDFSHQGEDCTLETLLDRFGIEDAAVRAVAEIVHDIDLKDAKFGRRQAAGVEAVLKGLVAAGDDDQELLARGFDLFDNLLAGLGSTRGSNGLRGPGKKSDVRRGLGNKASAGKKRTQSRKRPAGKKSASKG